MTMDDPAELFSDEVTDRLDQMDAGLLAVESGVIDPGTIDALFRHAHTIKGTAAMLGMDDISAVACDIEDVLAAARQAGAVPSELAAPLLRATAVLRAQVAGSAGPEDDVRTGLADAKAALTATTGPGTTPEAEPGREPETGPELETGPEPEAAPESEPRPEPETAPAGQAAQQRPLRVPAEKIDHLLDLVGEVVHDRSRLAHALGPETGMSQDVSDVLGAGDRTLEQLKDVSVAMRTLPLETIARPLPRAVRDMARAAGKEVELVVTGASTELDRVILESLSEPLTHLLRNAVSHGIETPAERELAGKPRCGRIELRAEPRGRLVEIVVADDGRGVSAEAARAGRTEGSLAEVLSRPGYSTAPEVSDLAGRGVGLDAVKTYVQSLAGTMDVRSSTGAGMEVVLLLPLALALLDVLLFERSRAVFGVPMAVVEEVVVAVPDLVLSGKPALNIRGRAVPVTDFAVVAGMNAAPLGERPPALVIAAGGRRAIIACDSLLGQQEVAVKPLGSLLAGVEGYLGAAILGDGRVALLAEPAILTRSPRPAAAAPPAAAPAATPKILVAEDSFTVRELQRSILETAGYSVVTARDGREALHVLERDSDVALVVTDLEMPELDGFELTQSIRADPARSSLPVVIVTSHTSEDERRRGIDVGADAYMAKGRFDQHALLATVEPLVGR